MALEIERRFLIDHLTTDAPRACSSFYIEQGYFDIKDTGFRVRICDGRTAYVAHKIGSGLIREELESPIEVELAKIMMSNCCLRIDKTRQLIEDWEVDFFCSPLGGLIFAEKPLTSPTEPVIPPQWMVRPVEITNIISTKKIAEFVYFLLENGYKEKLTSYVLDMIHQKMRP